MTDDMGALFQTCKVGEQSLKYHISLNLYINAKF